MNIRTLAQPAPPLSRDVARAVAELKDRLQEDYEEAYPGLGEIIRLVLDEEETRAWEFTSFPHLLLPDLVEAHIATLGLDAPETRDDELEPPRLAAQPALAFAF